MDQILKCSADAICKAMQSQLNDGPGGKGLSPMNTLNFHEGTVTLLGVAYRRSAKAKGILLNVCPWCRGEPGTFKRVGASSQQAAVSDGMVAVSKDLIRRAQKAINFHLEPTSPDEHEATMFELLALLPEEPEPAHVPELGQLPDEQLIGDASDGCGQPVGNDDEEA